MQVLTHNHRHLTLTLKTSFQGIHCLREAGLKDIKTHGHNYELEVCVQGPLGHPSGWITSRAALRQTIDAIISKCFPSSRLNQVLPSPSGEAIATTLFMAIKNQLETLSLSLVQITLIETNKNAFTIQHERQI